MANNGKQKGIYKNLFGFCNLYSGVSIIIYDIYNFVVSKMYKYLFIYSFTSFFYRLRSGMQFNVGQIFYINLYFSNMYQVS